MFRRPLAGVPRPRRWQVCSRHRAVRPHLFMKRRSAGLRQKSPKESSEILITCTRSGSPLPKAVRWEPWESTTSRRTLGNGPDLHTIPAGTDCEADTRIHPGLRGRFRCLINSVPSSRSKSGTQGGSGNGNPFVYGHGMRIRPLAALRGYSEYYDHGLHELHLKHHRSSNQLLQASGMARHGSR